MIAFTVYRGLTDLAEPVVRHYLHRRMRKGREDPDRFGERLGLASCARPDGMLLWLHAASVGESLSTLTLLERLRAERPDLEILVTTGTVTSARLLGERLPAGVRHQYVPVDRAFWVRRFLDHWQPDLALWVESEFWPNLLRELGARGVPTVLLNARISPRSFRRWRRVPFLARQLLGHFDHCLAQTADDAARLERLGAPSVTYSGNLKFAAAKLPCDASEVESLGAAIGARPAWVAASTHPGEESVIADAHARLRDRLPGLLTIIVPRHPARGPVIAAELRAAGLNVARRSAGEIPLRESDIYIADTMGELGLFYRAVSVVFVGGSLISHGGQNPLEPAQLGNALIHGPFMTNFREIAGDLSRAGAAAVVDDSQGLVRELAVLLSDPAEAARRGKAARDVALAKRGVLDTVMRELRPYLDRLDHSNPEAMRRARA